MSRVFYVFVVFADKRDWFSLDKDSSKLAPFCSKSQPDAAAPAEAVVATTDADPAVGAGSQSVDMLADAAWLAGLKAGSLVDCKDKANSWYQVKNRIPTGLYFWVKPRCN